MDFITLFADENIVKGIESVISSVRELAIQKMLPLFLSIAILKGIWSYWTERDKWGIEMKEVMRLGLVMLFLFSYISVISILDSMMLGIISHFDLEVENEDKRLVAKRVQIASVQKNYSFLTRDELQRLEKKLGGNYEDVIKITEDFIEKENIDVPEESKDEGNWMDKLNAGITDTLELFDNFKKTWPTIILGGATRVVLFIVKMIMWLLIASFVMIIKVFGPLAIVVELAFPGQLSKWFMTYATAQMTILSMAVIESVTMTVTRYFYDSVIYPIGEQTGGMSGLGATALSAGMNQKMSSAAVGAITGGMKIAKSTSILGMIWTPTMAQYLVLGLSVVSILMYALSFWLTSIWFGSESAGKIMSTAGGAATMAMSGGATKLGGMIVSSLSKSKLGGDGISKGDG